MPMYIAQHPGNTYPQCKERKAPLSSGTFSACVCFISHQGKEKVTKGRVANCDINYLVLRAELPLKGRGITLRPVRLGGHQVYWCCFRMMDWEGPEKNICFLSFLGQLTSLNVALIIWWYTCSQWCVWVSSPPPAIKAVFSGRHIVICWKSRFAKKLSQNPKSPLY